MKSKLPIEDIRVLGCMSGEEPSIHEIQQVLLQKQQELGREGDFIGKPTTHLYFDTKNVVKLHPQKIFADIRIAQTWVQHLLEKERQGQIYHPDRSWFILFDGEHWIPGNITPRMQPVHLLFKSLKKLNQTHLEIIANIIAIYLDYAANQEKRLDEGLSNFGLYHGKIYYLDDDIFEWDHFHAFSALLANWLRCYSETWLHGEALDKLGKTLYHLLYTYFHESESLDAPNIVAEQLYAMFYPIGAIQDAANTLIHILRHSERRTENQTKKHYHNLQDFSKCFDEDDPIAILADIHANLPALEVVLGELKKRHISRIFVLGDLVGYGPHPEACIKRLQEIGAISIRGNHDHAIGTGNMVQSMTSSSSWTAEWTIPRLSKEQRNYLKSLPLCMQKRPWLAIHGAPIDKTFFNAYVYDRTADNNLFWLRDNGYRFALHGHSHIQGIYTLQGENVSCIKNKTHIELKHFQTCLICPGSIGQPRGGNAKAGFAILKPRSLQLEFIQFEYNIQEVIQDMIVEKFPEQLIRRLQTGT